MNARPLIVTSVFAAGALALTACGGGSTPAASGSVSSGGNVKVGIKFDQPGMGLKVGDTYSGFDVDVAKYIATKLGVTPEFVEAPSGQRETMIKTDQVKYIVGTYSITDARKADVSFAGPYFIAGQDLLVRTDEKAITGPESLGGKKLCSVKGSTSAKKIKDQYPTVQLQEYDTYSKCVEELIAGTVDALTTDNTILAGYAAQDAYKGKVKVLGKPFSTENYGVGLKKGDVAFCNQVSDALKQMVSSGDWKKAVDANLGPAGFTVPAGNPPALATCS